MANVLDADRLVKPLNRVLTCQADDMVPSAAETMRTHKVGCLIVLNPKGTVVGILTERDIISRVAATNCEPGNVPIHAIMTDRVISCGPDTSIIKARQLMVDNHVRHLPIICNGRPAGMISSRDVIACQLMAIKAMKLIAEQVASLTKGLRDLPLHELVDRITTNVPKIFGARHSALCLPHGPYAHGNQPEVHEGGCLCPTEVPRLRTRLGRITSGAPMLIGDVPAACLARGARTPQVLIPLGEWKDVRGAQTDPAYLCLCSLSQTPPVAGDLVRYASGLLRDVLGANLASALLYQEAATDPLTGTATRRILEERLQTEYERAMRYPSQFAVAILDVDHFKQVNDRFGHQAGDRALQAVAGILLSGLRETDLVARYGGDEFVILMPETTVDNAVIVIERLRSHLATGCRIDDFRLTASCGVTAWSGEAADVPAHMVRRADMALYEAKRSGRNRVRVFKADAALAPEPQAAARLG